jgi:regulator of sigma E protease
MSINLGLINLFPIPALDGGHLLFYAAEALRGKPLPERVQEIGSMAGVAMLAMLMGAATWNDIVRLVQG